MPKPTQATSAEALRRLKGGVFVTVRADGSHHMVATHPYIAVQGKTEQEAHRVFGDALTDWFEERDAAIGAEREYYDNLRMPFWEQARLRFLVFRDKFKVPNRRKDDAKCQQENHVKWHPQNAH